MSYFFYLKVSQTNVNISKREFSETKMINGMPQGPKQTVNLTSVDMDPMTIFTLGGGYRF